MKWTFDNKFCPRINHLCHGTLCVQFASCMTLEIKAMVDMGMRDEAIIFHKEIVKMIKEEIL